jgi:hypothetical protein
MHREYRGRRNCRCHCGCSWPHNRRRRDGAARDAHRDPPRSGGHGSDASRKGVQLRDMTPAQGQAALALLRSALSQAGYEKSLLIMSLDEILRRLEGDRAKNIRDPRRYFFTIFGVPADAGTWGLSVEGHHLSFNFTVRDGAVVDSTPQFMGANPAAVKTTFAGLPEAGHRVLRDEETLAFELVRSLDATQQASAVTAEPPKEMSYWHSMIIPTRRSLRCIRIGMSVNPNNFQIRVESLESCYGACRNAVIAS